MPAGTGLALQLPASASTTKPVEITAAIQVEASGVSSAPWGAKETWWHAAPPGSGSADMAIGGGTTWCRIAVSWIRPPFAIATAHEGGGYDGYIALGCVIRGETSHYDLICNEVARACQNLATDGGLVIGFGLLTVENESQAVLRADPNGKDKGGEAANACMMNLKLARRFLDQ